MYEKRKIKFGFIGLGRRGIDHLSIARMFKEISIEALCDTNESRLREVSSNYGSRAYTNLDDMLKEEKLDVAVISTPTQLHIPQTIKCLNKGLDVILEKPIALNISEVIDLLKIIKKSDRIAMVGFQFRYSDDIEKAKDTIDRDTLSMVVGHYYWTVPLVKWIALREQGGGQIVDQAIHLIDTIRFVTEDDVEKLYAIYTEKGRNTKEDKALGFDNWTSYIVCLKFKKSAIGAIYSTYALYPRIFEAEREKAEAILDSQVSMDIICRDMLIRCIPAHETRIYRKNRETETYRSSGKPEVKMYRNFIEAILTRDKSLIRTPYEDSYKTMAISLAANESAMTGKIINLEEYVAC